jgi:hypothetical protein
MAALIPGQWQLFLWTPAVRNNVLLASQGVTALIAVAVNMLAFWLTQHSRGRRNCCHAFGLFVRDDDQRHPYRSVAELHRTAPDGRSPPQRALIPALFGHRDLCTASVLKNCGHPRAGRRSVPEAALAPRAKAPHPSRRRMSIPHPVRPFWSPTLNGRSRPEADSTEYAWR